jgi:multiple antibiotic resistance protein
MRDFWLCFLPLLVAVDAIGVLPIFMSLTEEVEPADRRRIVVQSVITAAVVALAFLAGGKAVLSFLGVTVADFLIAGGTLLFVLSLNDLLTAEKRRRRVGPANLGAVPLGVPLIVGPAVLSTIFILVGEYGILPTVAATLVNIALAGVVFWFCTPIERLLGRAGTRAVSKLAALLLAAIAVRMVRKGLLMVLSGV